MPNFQSYLIIGRGEKKRDKTNELAKNVGIDLNKVSPDTSFILPIKKTIGIDQIRELKKQIFQKPVKNKFKLVVIEQAEKLTTEAQNALLKIFEEPPSHAIIILEAKEKSQIIPTIQSRAIIKQVYDDKFDTDEINLLDETETSTLLEKITRIDNPTDWLDNQIILLYQLLTNLIAKKQSQNHAYTFEVSASKILKVIEECSKTKQMIDANINPKFALANLIFSLHISA